LKAPAGFSLIHFKHAGCFGATPSIPDGHLEAAAGIRLYFGNLPEIARIGWAKESPGEKADPSQALLRVSARRWHSSSARICSGSPGQGAQGFSEADVNAIMDEKRQGISGIRGFPSTVA